MCGSSSWAPLLISWSRSRLQQRRSPKRRPQTQKLSLGRSPPLSSFRRELSPPCPETLCHLCSTSASPFAASTAWPTACLLPDCDLGTWIDHEIWNGDLFLEAIEISSRGPATASEASCSSFPKSLEPPDRIFRRRDDSEVAVGHLDKCTRMPMMALWAAAWRGQAFLHQTQIS